MSTWTGQMGFPVINVKSIKPKEGGGVTVSVTQEKFNADGSTSEGYDWKVIIIQSVLKWFLLNLFFTVVITDSHQLRHLVRSNRGLCSGK